MTAKEYLNRVRRQYYVVKQVEQEARDIHNDIITIRASSLSEKVSGSKSSDTADKYIRLERYEDKVIAEAEELQRMREEAKRRINALPDGQQQAVLYARYINNKRWEEICVEMHYSWKGIFKLHGRALKAFEEVHRSTLNKGV